MASRLEALVVDAHDPAALARFWAGLLGWAPVEDPVDGVALLPSDDTGFRLRFSASRRPKAGQNSAHVDLTSASSQAQAETVARALRLGARHVDVGQGPEDEHVVLADPEGNEFCVIEPGNAFLADCGAVGALACDGTQEVGYFWSRALGWPLVWDQDQETAIRSPHGGPKLTWGGTAPVPGRQRLHLDLAPTASGDAAAEVERLLATGASLMGPGPHGTVLADPDGQEFCVVHPGS